MKVRLLHTTGNGRFEETTWDKPDITDNEIEVRAIMTGVCRSDIAMMCGEFGPLPLHMQGHEGLGQVTKVGKKVYDVLVGEFVATRGEPAYADFYNAKHKEYVVVPEAHPRYIIEPVACGINLMAGSGDSVCNYLETKGSKRVLILGTGFLAQVCYQLLKDWYPDLEALDVLGKSNADRFPALLPAPNGQYDVVIDLGGGTEVFDQDILRNNALVIMGNQKPVSTDFANLLWKSVTMRFPSPRNADFHYHMQDAVNFIQVGDLKVDHLWTNAYNRDTEWQQAFSDGLNRPSGYGRGYIIWN